MAFLRTYEKIYSFPVISGKPLVNTENVKIFFNQCPEILNKNVKSLSASYNISQSNANNCFITLKDKNNKILLYNYPLVDLYDTTRLGITTVYPFRLRLFNLNNLDLQKSYYFFNSVTTIFPVGVNPPPLFYLNFYIEE